MNRQQMIDQVIRSYIKPYASTHDVTCQYAGLDHIHISPLPNKDIELWCVENGYTQHRVKYCGMEFVTLVKKG